MQSNAEFEFDQNGGPVLQTNIGQQVANVGISANPLLAPFVFTVCAHLPILVRSNGDFLRRRITVLAPAKVPVVFDCALV